MTLTKLIQILQTHQEEMGDVEVKIVQGDAENIIEISDVDFGYHMASIDSYPNADVPFVHIYTKDMPRFVRLNPSK